MTNRLLALDVSAGAPFVETLQQVWDHGDAAFVIDSRWPPPLRDRILDAMAPAAVIDDDGVEHARSGSRPVETGDALVVATSGSTGDPKGVVLTHDAVAASALTSGRRLGVTPDDHWLACLPLAHVGGLTVVTKAIHQGTKLTILPRFDAHAVNTSTATMVSLVTAVLDRVDIGVFRKVVIGGSAPPPSLPANVVSTYGMTETGSGVVYDGVPLDGVEIGLDERQEIRIKSPTLLRAYRDGTDPKRDGWFDTGDLGGWDADGRFVVYGRGDDMIVSGGENVHPAAVEAALARHDAVGEVGVAGIPDATWGSLVVAFVVPAGPPPTLESLRDHVKRTLPAYAAPRRLVIVESLPRTSLGKVRRSKLAGYIDPDRTPAPPSIT